MVILMMVQIALLKLKRVLFIFFFTLNLFFFNIDILFGYSFLYEDIYRSVELLNIIEKYKVYYIGDVVSVVFVFNKKPIEIISNNSDIYIRNFLIEYKNYSYYCKVDFQFFNIGSIELKNVKFIFSFEEYDLTGNKIFISSINNENKKKYNFYEVNKFFTFNPTFFNFIIYLVFLSFLFLATYFLILFFIKIKNKYKTLIMKRENLIYLNKLKNELHINPKKVIFDISEYIKKINFKLNDNDKLELDKLKYKYTNEDLKINIKFIEIIIDKLIKYIKEDR
ncbi:MAG: hypothetical protein N3A58_03895 [Spirochaetes bacterium]|nr:hypothetical protein [Spirochaetota bacterium]